MLIHLLNFYTLININIPVLNLELPISPQGPSLDEIVLDTDTKIFDEFLEN